MPAPKSPAPKSQPRDSVLDIVLHLGSTSIQPGGNGAAAPAGTLHLVAGWQPLCGGDRVRFVFPGRRPAAAETCPACVQASVPKPRSAPRSRARAS